jgi:zinc transporter 1
MGWSKEKRILTMLCIDSVFFLIELGGGIYARSLALQADAFHMLNDIISLGIGLWAVRAASRATTDKYTYGWVRAEILGASFNAVFLIALCVTIFLEAISRFIDPPEIRDPQFIFGVGTFGLISNIAGFFVLGGHGHSHGPGGHDHGSSHNDEHHAHDHDHAHNHGHGHGHGDNEQRAAEEGTAIGVAIDSHPTESHDSTIARSQRRDSTHSRHPRRNSTRHHHKLSSIDDMSIHPARFRQEIIEASRNDDLSESEQEDAVADERTSLLSQDGARSRGTMTTTTCKGGNVHAEHHHAKPKSASKGHGHGHNHGDMGMNAMVLHVIGDALGNVGVMAAAAFIWTTSFWWKNYVDPAVSLLITVIILCSAIPLTVATARILLQATPEHIDVRQVREDIERLDGILSCHHIHVWQLSDTKLVASMHLQLDFALSEEQARQYTDLAHRVRECLHGHGIHSVTIQPEFKNQQSSSGASSNSLAGTTVAGAELARAGDLACDFDGCVENCVGQGCCSASGSSRRSSHSSHNV